MKYHELLIFGEIYTYLLLKDKYLEVYKHNKTLLLHSVGKHDKIKTRYDKHLAHQKSQGTKKHFLIRRFMVQSN